MKIWLQVEATIDEEVPRPPRGADLIEVLEEEIEGLTLEVPRENGRTSVYSLEVTGSGKTEADLKESIALRKQQR